MMDNIAKMDNVSFSTIVDLCLSIESQRVRHRYQRFCVARLQVIAFVEILRPHCFGVRDLSKVVRFSANLFGILPIGSGV